MLSNPVGGSGYCTKTWKSPGFTEHENSKKFVFTNGTVFSKTENQLQYPVRSASYNSRDLKSVFKNYLFQKSQRSFDKGPRKRRCYRYKCLMWTYILKTSNNLTNWNIIQSNKSSRKFTKREKCLFCIFPQTSVHNSSPLSLERPRSQLFWIDNFFFLHDNNLPRFTEDFLDTCSVDQN